MSSSSKKPNIVKVMLCDESDIPSETIKPVNAKPIPGSSNENPESRYAGRTNVELKNVLKGRGLVVTGKKEELIARLVKYDNEHGYNHDDDHGNASDEDDGTPKKKGLKKVKEAPARKDIPIVMQTGAAAALAIDKASKKAAIVPAGNAPGSGGKSSSTSVSGKSAPTYDSKTTNDALKNMCGAVSLPKSGNKSDLLARLDEYYGKADPVEEIQVKLGTPRSDDETSDESDVASSDTASDDSDDEEGNVLEKESSAFLKAGDDAEDSAADDDDSDGSEEDSDDSDDE